MDNHPEYHRSLTEGYISGTMERCNKLIDKHVKKAMGVGNILERAGFASREHVQNEIIAMRVRMAKRKQS
jgi:hypothetical protein